MVIAFGFVVLAGLLVWRLAMLQVVEPEEYVEWGRGQRFDTIELQGSRGDIVDRNGEQLAVSLPQRSFFADPAYVTDPSAAADVLAPLLGLEVLDVYDRLTASSNFSWLARQVTDDMADTLDALEIAGVYSMEEPARFNPAGATLGAGMIGSVGIDNQGLSGLELIYDEVLSGAPGEMILERDERGNTIPQGQIELRPATQGSDVVLTLDRALQFEVERILVDTVNDMAAKGAVAVVSDPRTGEILSSATVRRDDLGAAEVSIENHAATWTYEPGSIMKAITFAGVLESGIAEPETPLLVPDQIKVYDSVFADHDPHAPVEWTVSDIVTQSSNVGTVTWAQELGADRFEAMMHSFGFGHSTGLGLPGETPGLMIRRADYTGTTLAANALGQGISVTPIQMLSAFNVIANDGVYASPRLVRDIVDPSGRYEAPAEDEARRVISQETARKMGLVLQNVVDAGTGRNAAIDGYDVAGKTGTARKAQPGGGYLDADGHFHYVSSFIGFLPASDPKVSILIAVDEPTTTYYASAAAAPAFARIARYALRHFQIPPTVDLLQPSASNSGVPTNTDSVDIKARGTAAQAPGNEAPGAGGQIAAVDIAIDTDPAVDTAIDADPAEAGDRAEVDAAEEAVPAEPEVEVDATASEAVEPTLDVAPSGEAASVVTEPAVPAASEPETAIEPALVAEPAASDQEVSEPALADAPVIDGASSEPTDTVPAAIEPASVAAESGTNPVVDQHDAVAPVSPSPEGVPAVPVVEATPIVDESQPVAANG